MNQSKLEANTCGLREARVSAFKQATNGFGFTSDWIKIKLAREFLANRAA